MWTAGYKLCILEIIACSWRSWNHSAPFNVFSSQNSLRRWKKGTQRVAPYLPQPYCGQQTRLTCSEGQVFVSSESKQWVVLTVDERKNLKRLKEQNRKTESPAHKKGTKPQGGLHAADRTDRHLKYLTNPWHPHSWHQPPLPAGVIPTCWLQTFYTHLVYSPQIPLQVISATAKLLSGHFRVWIPNLGTLPIIALVSLTHLPFLCACFYESLSCVMLSSLPVFLPVLRALHALCSVLYPWLPFCFLSPFSTHLIDTYVTVPIHVRINLRICLNYFSIYMFICLIPTYVYIYMCTHFPPAPYP